MPIVNHATRLITCKLVYYGPGDAGKEATLSYLHSALPDAQVGNLKSVATRRDRMLCFEYLPLELGTVGAYRVQFQLCTVSGVAQNRASRQRLLAGADGIAFVADSRRESLEQNLASLQDLHLNLADQAVAARSLPFVFQYNKQDLHQREIMSAHELSAALNFRNAPEFATSASDGRGLCEGLSALESQVLRRLGARNVTHGELLEASA